MSNKLPKNKKQAEQKTNTADNIKTLFSFNTLGNKVYSVYENSKKKESAIKRSGVNNIISIIVIMLLALVIGYTQNAAAIVIAVAIMAVIEIGVSVWKLYNEDNKKIWITAIIINAIFAVSSIIMLVYKS